MEGSVAFSGTLIGGITGGGEGTNNYNDLINKPSINGIPLSGNKTSSDLHLFTGDYSDLSNKPTINGVTVEGSLTSADLNMFDGDYDHLTNKPTLFSGDYPDLTNKPTINGNTLVGNKTTSDLGLFSGNYNDLTNKPTLFSGDYDDLTDRPRINNHTLSGDMSSADLDIFSGDYNDLTNKPTLFSGDYNDLTNKPTIPVIEFNPVAAAVDEVDKASLNGVIYDIKDSAARSDVMLAIDNAAAVYDPEGEYLVGDYCTHDGIMYQCNTDITSPGEEWDPTHWDVTDCGIELNEIKQSLSDLDFEDITSSLTFSGYYIATHTNFKCFKSKSIMYINVALQLQNNPPANTPIITGFPTNIAINPSLGTMSGGKVVRINSSGQLTNDDALSSGWLTGSFVVLLTN